LRPAPRSAALAQRWQSPHRCNPRSVTAERSRC
jgi:hypothetical protein